MKIAPRIEAVFKQIVPVCEDIVVIREEDDLFRGAISELAPRIKAIREDIALMSINNALFHGAIFKIAPRIGINCLEIVSIRVEERTTFEEILAISVAIVLISLTAAPSRARVSPLRQAVGLICSQKIPV